MDYPSKLAFCNFNQLEKWSAECSASFLFLYPNQGVQIGGVRLGESEWGSPSRGIRMWESESGSPNPGIQIQEPESGNLNLGI